MNSNENNSFDRILNNLNSILKQKSRVFSFYKPYEQKFVSVIKELSTFYLHPYTIRFADTNIPFTLIHPDLKLLSNINSSYFGNPDIRLSMVFIQDSGLINAYLAFLFTRFSDTEHKKTVRKFERLSKQREESLKKKWQTIYRHSDNVLLVCIKEEITTDLVNSENHSYKPNDLLKIIELKRKAITNKIENHLKKQGIKCHLFYWIISAERCLNLDLHLSLVFELPEASNISWQFEDSIKNLLDSNQYITEIVSLSLNNKINGKYIDREKVYRHIEALINLDKIVRPNPYYFAKNTPLENSMKGAINSLEYIDFHEKISSNTIKINNKSFFGIIKNTPSLSPKRKK